jgi:hypothetical protein
VSATRYFDFRFIGFPQGTRLDILDDKGNTVAPDNLGVFSQTIGNYTYVANCSGYRPLRGVVSLTSQSPATQEVNLAMTPLAAGDWDGVSQTMPAQVTAAESHTVGGAFEGMEDFYKITQGSDLAWFAQAVNSGQGTISAILTNDIHLSDFEWTKIGNNNAANAYKGTFDGGGHTIRGLYINATTTYQGLFGYINAATLKNLALEGSVKSTANNSYVGGFAAYSSNGTRIENCHNRATVSGTTYVGGILGYSTNAPLQIINCTNSGTVTASNSNAGGILGLVSGTTAIITEVANSGTVSGRGDSFGGIAGSSDGAQIRNAINTGDILSPSARVGGISGHVAATGSITHAYNTGITAQYAIAPNGPLANVYTLGDDSPDAIGKTAEAFASGEVAWLLGDAFGQALGTDVLPALGGTAVYQVTYTNNLDTETGVLYTNGALPEMAREGYSAVWKTAADGTTLTAVTGDAVLYLHYTREYPEGLDTPAADVFRVFPNPFTDYLVIEAAVGGTLALYNLAGQLVLSADISAGMHRISVMGLPRGGYFLRFGARTIKVIK